MAYIIKARFYAGPDQIGESYVITSDNNLPDTRLEVGKSMKFVEAQPQDSADNPKCIECGIDIDRGQFCYLCAIKIDNG